ncbi:alpha/beta hydrolase [bacterium]|nr:alpha/beta hydrolase [bacterium]
MKILLLRGLLRDKRHWGNFPEILDQSLGGKYHIELLDLPGIGTEISRPFPLNMDEVVHDLRRRSGVIDNREELLIVSNSLGSMISMHWAALYPEDIKGLVLMNTSASNLSNLKERLSVKALQVFAKVVASKDPVERERLILSIVSRRYGNDLEQAKTWSEYALTHKEMLELGMRQLWVASRFELVAPLEVPSLMLCSTQDELIDPVACMKVAKALGADQRFNHKGGHDLPLDEPEWIGQEINQWLQLFSSSTD